MRRLASTVIPIALAAAIAACDPPDRAVLLDDDDIHVVVVERRPDRLEVQAQPSAAAALVDVHYRVNGGPQLNYRMDLDGPRWQFDIQPLASGDVVDLFLTFERDGPTLDTPWLQHVYRGTTGTALDPTPPPTATPSPVPTATPITSPSTTPPADEPLGAPLSPTDYTHAVFFDGVNTSIQVRPGIDLGPSTVSWRLGEGPEQSMQLQRDGPIWRADFAATPGQTLTYSFFLAMPGRTSTLYLRSVTHEVVVGAPPAQGPAPLVVDTAGRFRDRHENERRFDPFIEGYFEASTFAVRVLDFGHALDVTVAVEDDTEFVDIKLFDTDPTPPHERAPEVRADYRVAARMLDHDDPATGARTWHWRQERDEVRDLDLAPSSFVDFEFTIRRVQGQPVHGGSNGQYYTAVFRHRMGEPGLTELLTAPEARVGGTASVYVMSEPEWSFAQAARNLDHAGLLRFLRGKRAFDRDFASDGAAILGPRFDATSCADCHIRDGSAPPPGGPTDDRPGMTVGLDGTPAAAVYGRQLQRDAVPGVSAEGRLALGWITHGGTFSDDTPYELVSPAPEIVDAAFGPVDAAGASLRVAPRLIGLGLLAAVPASTIIAGADPDDLDGDGISGRARSVTDEDGGAALGRFGWKADGASIRQQTARAYLRDLGLTSSILPTDDETPANPAPIAPVEIRDDELDDVTAYLETLGVPIRLDGDDPVVQQGLATFIDVGCAACHVPSLATAIDHPNPALRDQQILPWTDLLLHDMGPDLADHPAGGPWATEWRTPPLWGIGLTGAVGGHTRFLHDGRARSLLEAILWHGGEGAAARDRVLELDAEGRATLIRFLESL